LEIELIKSICKNATLLMQPQNQHGQWATRFVLKISEVHLIWLIY